MWRDKMKSELECLWQKAKDASLFLYIIVSCWGMVACMGGGNAPSSSLTWNEWMDSAYATQVDSVYANLRLLAQNKSEAYADEYVRNYYAQKERPSLLWLSWDGIDSRADSLVQQLQTVEEEGLSVEGFELSEIQRLLSESRRPQVCKMDAASLKLLAQTEYKLTL